jgi:hypothetical protein
LLLVLSGFGAASVAFLTAGEFLGEVQDQPAILFRGLAEKAAKLVEENGVLAFVAPAIAGAGFPVGEVWRARRFVAVVQELVERDLEGGGELFKSFERRNGMAVFDAGEIGTEQAGARFNIALGEFPFFAEFAETLADYHKSDYTIGYVNNQVTVS